MPHPIQKAIVPAAGLGTRLLPATKSQPKEMLPVGRKPDHFDPDSMLLSALEQAGNEALLSELSYIQRNSRFFYTRQSSPKGLGHAVGLGAEFVDDDACVVALGDSMIAGEDPAALLRAMMQTHRDLDAAAIIAVEQVSPDDTHRYGIISIEGSEPPPGEPVMMTGIIEKPPRGTAPSTLAVAARYVFSPAIFEVLGRTPTDRQGEIQLSDAIKLLVQAGQPVYAWLLHPDQRRYDIGNFESYIRTFIDFVLADERYGYLARQYIKAKAYDL